MSMTCLEFMKESVNVGWVNIIDGEGIDDGLFAIVTTKGCI